MANTALKFSGIWQKSRGETLGKRRKGKKSFLHIPSCGAGGSVVEPYALESAHLVLSLTDLGATLEQRVIHITDFDIIFH